MSQKKEISESALQALYIRQGLPIRAVAGMLGCSESTVKRNLKKYKLQKRDGAAS